MLFLFFVQDVTHIAEGIGPRVGINVLDCGLSLAGFQVIIDGRFWVITEEAIAGVKPSDEIEMEFILHAINAVKPRLLLERRGVRQKNLSLRKITDIALPMPKRSDQRAVVSRLQAVSAQTQRLESIYQQKLAALDALKKSLLHQAFTGAL